jgi:multidrug resistance efflux pump
MSESKSEAPKLVAVDAETKPTPSRRKKILPVIALVLVAGGGGWWLHTRGYEDTDDAQIDGTISNISPRITGTI